MATQKRTDIDIEHFRQRLMEEKTLAEQTIAGTNDLEGDQQDDQTGSMRSELSTADNHPADVATELQTREQDDALIANAEELLGKIERALAKMEDGTYGISDRSGEPIPVERLEAVPYATVTTEEQALEEIA
ncbi:MAG: TraR/DksA C4-type zinc finger protein [Armatimonadota bacterium]